MNQGGALEFVIAGVAGLLIISLMFWIGHALLGWLEHETLPESESLRGKPEQSVLENPAGLPIEAGQRRLATQSEHNDINAKIERTHPTPVPTAGQL